MGEKQPGAAHLEAISHSRVGSISALEAVFEAAGTGLVIYDGESRVDYVDSRIERFFGLSAGEIVGVPRERVYREYFEPCFADGDPETGTDSQAGGTEDEGETYRVTAGRQRSERWLTRHRHSIDQGALVGGSVEQFEDVSDERHARTLEKYHQIVENIDDGVFIVDRDRELEYANASALEASNRSLDAIAGKDIREVTRELAANEEQTNRFVEALDTVFDDDANAYPVEVELRVELETGPATLRYRCSPLPTENGRKVVVTVRNVSEHVERERRYETLLDNFPEGAVTLVDQDLRYQLARGELFDSLPETPADFEGAKLGDVDSGNREEVTEAYRKALAGEPVNTETTVRDQTLIHRTRPVYDAEGAVRAAIGMTQDITERKEREHELERTNEFLGQIQAVANVGCWEVNLRSQSLHWSDEVNRLHGVSADYEPSMDEALAFYHPDDWAAIADAYEALLREGESYDMERRIVTADGEVRWVRTIGRRWYDESGAVVGARGTFQDITERKEREKELQKRQRVLRELHEATRAFRPLNSEEAVSEFIVSFLERAFDFEYVSVKQFDDSDAVLEPTARANSDDGETVSLGPVSPGSDPIWDAFRANETRVLDAEGEADIDAGAGGFDQSLLVPIEDFGVTVVLTGGDEPVADVDVDLIEVVAANAESEFRRLRSERTRTELAAELSSQREHVSDLQSLIEAFQFIQRRVGNSENKEALRFGACEELVETDRIDFAWIGVPEGNDTALSPVAWAGDGEPYFVRLDAGENRESLPAQHAAADREQYTVPSISSMAIDEQWAKNALSAGYNSVISVPLVYDGVLYGVLTAYSETEEGFGPRYETLLLDVASLLENHGRNIQRRYVDSSPEQTELEFELPDDRYPLHRLAAVADATIRYVTVTESTSDSVRCLVSVEDEPVDRVLDAASSVTGIFDAELFGDTEYGQLSLTVTTPFLPSLVAKHGGSLGESVSDGSTTRVRIEVPSSHANRPVLDALQSRYDRIDLVAQRQTTSAGDSVPGLEDILTDRQYEVLTTAYHGGYYETPRNVTGEELAESFDISSPAIYNHLQAAHRSLLETVLE